MKRFPKVVKILLYFNYIWLIFGVILATLKPLRNNYSYKLTSIIPNLAKLDPVTIFEMGMIFLVTSSLIALASLSIDLYETKMKKYAAIVILIILIQAILLMNALI